MTHQRRGCHTLCGSAGLLAAALTGCASVDVNKVTEANNATVEGQRYYLPKPIIIVAPQADGTVSVTVDYLPDKTHEYAINAKSRMSSYTMQISTDIRGLLTAVEYKASTTAVAQQLAASAGAAAAQAANVSSAQLLAVQTAVATAQATVDTDKQAADAAHAQLTSDEGAPSGAVTPTALAADAASAATADAKLADARAVLTRTQASVQLVAANAAAATPTTTTGPTMGTIFGQPTWTPPAQLSLPQAYGAVVFTVDDSIESKTEKVALRAQTGALQDTIQCVEGAKGCLGGAKWQDGVTPAAQPVFATTNTALGPPKLTIADPVVKRADKTATFSFDRPIASWTSQTVVTDAHPPGPTAVTPVLGDDNKTVTVEVNKLSPGKYVLTATATWNADNQGHILPQSVSVKFTVK